MCVRWTRPGGTCPRWKCGIAPRWAILGGKAPRARATARQALAEATHESPVTPTGRICADFANIAGSDGGCGLLVTAQRLARARAPGVRARGLGKKPVSSVGSAECCQARAALGQAKGPDPPSGRLSQAKGSPVHRGGWGVTSPPMLLRTPLTPSHVSGRFMGS